MKKIFILLCLVFVTFVANAHDTKDDVIDRAKAIVAYHALSKKGCKGNFKKDKDTINAKNVDVLQKLIKKDPDKKFEKICKEIKEYDVDDKDTTSLIKSFEALLKKYNVNDKHALEQVKTPIRNSSRLFINEGTSNTGVIDESEDRDGDVGDNAESESQNRHDRTESSGITNVSQDNVSNADKDKYEKTEGFSSLLLIVILSLALLGSLFFCFQLWRKNQILENERSKIRENLRKITDRVNSNYANKDSLVELAGKMNAVFNTLIIKEKGPLEAKIKELEEKVDKSERKFGTYNNNFSTNRGNDYGKMSSNVVKSEESHSPTMTWDLTKENDERSIHESESPKSSLVGKEMFLYLPNDNMFKEGSEEYRSGKTLYKMVYTSEESADFEFINRPEALAFAKQSRSRFLEGACFIENDDAISFNTIQTLEKGKLAKADEGWNIISKARIRLS